MLRPVRSELVKAFPVRFTYALIVADAATGMLIAAGLPPKGPKGAESVTAFQASCWWGASGVSRIVVAFGTLIVCGEFYHKTVSRSPLIPVGGHRSGVPRSGIPTGTTSMWPTPNGSIPGRDQDARKQLICMRLSATPTWYSAARSRRSPWLRLLLDDSAGCAVWFLEVAVGSQPRGECWPACSGSRLLSASLAP
jgi:hypothetical protein